jgi:DNA topoisomerase-1
MGYFTIDLEEVAVLGEQWQKWLADVPERRDGRKSNGRTIREKNGWLAERNCLAAELVEIDGKKFKAKGIKTALKAAKRAGFELDEKIETEDPKAKGLAQRVINLRGHVTGSQPWRVKSLETKRKKSHPNAPYITSSLQQAAANQLDFTAQSTMRIAQALYEGVSVDGIGSVGLITYMRTDSTYLSGDAIKMARAYIGSQFGVQYLPPKANLFSSTNKMAQEAHEAIRPTDVGLTPDGLRSSLTEQQYKLYKIIWERLVACQMTDAEWDSTAILISGLDETGELVFRATGRVLVFDGYYKVTGIPNTLNEATIPHMVEEQPIAAIQIDPTQNFTSPPARYTEASLIKKLEAEGIGRPSTYAQIIQVIQNRKYVEKIQNRFYATDLGKVVTDKLIEAFPEIMEIGYTRDMEQRLDNIEENHSDWGYMLKNFYGPFKNNLDDAYERIGHAKAETRPASHKCLQCGSDTVYRFGRNGRFLSCSRYPDCKFAAPIDRDGNPISPEETDVACPKCGAPMLLRRGRFGAFLSCTGYPGCKGIVNLDKKGCVSAPKVPPLLTDLRCPKCKEPLNLRRGTRGLWLGCSKFPKCRGRMGWTSMEDKTKTKWEKKLKAHEKAHPQPVIRNLDGNPVGDAYRPQIQEVHKNRNSKDKLGEE